MGDRLRSIDPLRHDVPIVDASGRPTPQFMRQWMQTRSVDEAVVSASDTVTGLEDDFAAHGPRHHAGGDMELDLDSIAGALNGAKLYGDAELNQLIVGDVLRAGVVGIYDDPASDPSPTISFQGGAARITMAAPGGVSDTAVGRVSAGVFGGLLGSLNRADELGGSGQDSAFYLDPANHDAQSVDSLIPGSDFDVLRVAAGVPAWGKLTNDHIDAAAAIAWSKLAPPSTFAPAPHALNNTTTHTGTLAYSQFPTGGGTWNFGANTLTLTGNLSLSGITTSASANAGAAVLPSNPVGFINVTIGGISRRIAYFAA